MIQDFYNWERDLQGKHPSRANFVRYTNLSGVSDNMYQFEVEIYSPDGDGPDTYTIRVRQEGDYIYFAVKCGSRQQLGDCVSHKLFTIQHDAGYGGLAYTLDKVDEDTIILNIRFYAKSAAARCHYNECRAALIERLIRHPDKFMYYKSECDKDKEKH